MPVRPTRGTEEVEGYERMDKAGTGCRERERREGKRRLRKGGWKGEEDGRGERGRVDENEGRRVEEGVS